MKKISEVEPENETKILITRQVDLQKTVLLVFMKLFLNPDVVSLVGKLTSRMQVVPWAEVFLYSHHFCPSMQQRKTWSLQQLKIKVSCWSSGGIEKEKHRKVLFTAAIWRAKIESSLTEISYDVVSLSNGESSLSRVRLLSPI